MFLSLQSKDWQETVEKTKCFRRRVQIFDDKEYMRKVKVRCNLKKSTLVIQNLWYWAPFCFICSFVCFLADARWRRGGEEASK